MPIMKTIAKFECASAKITYCMASTPEDVVSLPALYLVKEEPKRRKAGWDSCAKYFDFSGDADAFFLKLVNFWIR